MKRSTVTAMNTQLRTALQEQFPTRTFELDGKPWTCAEVVAAIDAEDALVVQAARAHTAWLASTAALNERAAQNQQMRQALHTALKMTLGSTNRKLANFGFVTRERRKPTPVTQVVAAEKRRATRRARFTIGRRQRLRIHGEVPAQIVLAGSPTRDGTPSK